MHLSQISGINSPSNSVFTDYETLPSVLVSRVLIFAIFVAGFIFFFRLITSGFSYLTANGDQAKIQSATKGLTMGVTGLVIVVSAIFIAQIIEAIFGLNIL
jgi:hypothetical protein